MSVKMKYNVLSFLFYIAGCCFAGFVAVFLQYKGVSNTLIGVVTGSGCVAAIFLTPFLSSLVMKIMRLLLPLHFLHRFFYQLFFCIASSRISRNTKKQCPCNNRSPFCFIHVLFLSHARSRGGRVMLF